MPPATRPIRIIGGQWKSRRLRWRARADLRPTAEALRETLFNWLPHSLQSRVCLDLFAGSGALGFEAASRGADKVIMVEADAATAAMLRSNRDNLRGAAAVEIVRTRARDFLRRCCCGFDLVFLDPPFAAAALTETMHILQRRNLLNPDAMVYIESPQCQAPPPLPRAWRMVRQKSCGQARATLLQICCN